MLKVVLEVRRTNKENVDTGDGCDGLGVFDRLGRLDLCDEQGGRIVRMRSKSESGRAHCLSESAMASRRVVRGVNKGLRFFGGSDVRKHDSGRAPVEELTDLFGVEASYANDAFGLGSSERLQLGKDIGLSRASVFEVEK